MPNVLFAVSDWGLGHATRDIPLIRRMLHEGCGVTVLSTNRALALLRRELGARCDYLDWPGAPNSLAHSALLFYLKWASHIPGLFRSIIDERRRLAALLRERHFDRIISDSRYGIASPQVPSYHISHGLRVIVPARNRPFELLLEAFNYWSFRSVKKLIVPDVANEGLSGELSHDLRFFRADQIAYIGILSGIRRCEVPRDLDYFITISGPEPQRSILERVVLAQLDHLPGRAVVALGKPEEETRRWHRNGTEVFSFLNRCQQEEMMNRSRLVVTRSGYSTLMELVELGKQALLIPTPGQTEQLYLGWYHHRRGTFYSADQGSLDLRRDTERARAFGTVAFGHRTSDSVERFMEVVFGSYG